MIVSANIDIPSEDSAYGFLQSNGYIPHSCTWNCAYCSEFRKTNWLTRIDGIHFDANHLYLLPGCSLFGFCTIFWINCTDDVSVLSATRSQTVCFGKTQFDIKNSSSVFVYSGTATNSWNSSKAKSWRKFCYYLNTIIEKDQ